jgi:uncharacterized protein YjbI with pentapeptide repeats
MENLVNINQKFHKLTHAKARISYKEFEDCVFENCDFDQADLSNNQFLDCSFIDCNLSMVNLNNTSLKNCNFKNCKILGVMFNKCNDFLFEVNFSDSKLDFSSFSGKKMPKTNFTNCSFNETSFENTNLSLSNFDNCNLENTIFSNTNLNLANLSTSYNIKIDPEFNNLKKSKFSLSNISGLLYKYDIKIV